MEVREEEVKQLEKVIGRIEAEYGQLLSSRDLVGVLKEHLDWTIKEALRVELHNRYRQPKKFSALVRELLKRRTDESRREV